MVIANKRTKGQRGQKYALTDQQDVMIILIVHISESIRGMFHHRLSRYPLQTAPHRQLLLHIDSNRDSNYYPTERNIINDEFRLLQYRFVDHQPCEMNFILFYYKPLNYYRIKPLTSLTFVDIFCICIYPLCIWSKTYKPWNTRIINGLNNSQITDQRNFCDGHIRAMGIFYGDADDAPVQCG